MRQSLKNEIPRIKNLLNGAASDAERSSARMQRFMERQTQAARQTMQAASSAATAASAHAQTVEKNARAHERMAREVEQTRLRVDALNQKMREEQAQARAAQLGVSSAAEVYIRKMERAGKATHSLGLKSAAARRELGVLISQMARGNFGALRGSGDNAG
ncbi:hypothetical protein SF434370_2087 [Shigella flexneri 4343-70]|nr:hypothetical protein SF434370_2087 [Shigella flexneri 4343-70]